MKKLTWLLIPLFGFMMASCGEDADLANPNTVTDVVTQGKWKINIYLDASQDQTSDFAGYSLGFERNGVVTATCNGTDCSGSWSEDRVTRKLTINFPNASPVLERINNQWSVADINAALIHLSNNETGNEFLGITQQ